MFERFDNDAKHAIVRAQREALDHGHDFMGTEHVLLGVIGVEGLGNQVLGERGVTLAKARSEAVRIWVDGGVTGNSRQEAAAALASIGIDLDAIRRRADDTFGPGRFEYPRPGFTHFAINALKQSLRASLELGTESIGTGHLLLGLLIEGEGAAPKILTQLQVDVDELTPVVRARLS
jgi:ATP-dependent Clp protease ATP-binding subunit ClpC